MSKIDPLDIIEFIQDSITRIRQYTPETKQEFESNTMIQDAIIRNLETLSDATAQLPQDWKDEFPQVNWQRIKDFRNRLAHGYMSVNLDIIWQVIKLAPDLDEILDSVTAMEAQHGDDGDRESS
jgi:uncharacterized protein with HEPN domain